MQFYESLRSSISVVRIKSLAVATTEQIERMGGSCAICWGEMSEPKPSAPVEEQPRAVADGYALPCGHAYHKVCLTQWLHQCHAQGVAPTCPMCQQTILLEVKWRFPYPWRAPRDALDLTGDLDINFDAQHPGHQAGIPDHQRELQELLQDMPHIMPPENLQLAPPVDQANEHEVNNAAPVQAPVAQVPREALVPAREDLVPHQDLAHNLQGLHTLWQLPPVPRVVLADDQRSPAASRVEFGQHCSSESSAASLCTEAVHRAIQEVVAELEPAPLDVGGVKAGNGPPGSSSSRRLGTSTNGMEFPILDHAVNRPWNSSNGSVGAECAHLHGSKVQPVDADPGQPSTSHVDPDVFDGVWYGVPVGKGVGDAVSGTGVEESHDQEGLSPNSKQRGWFKRKQRNR